MCFYVMTKDDLQPEDNPTRIATINGLRKKLATLPEFEYLTRDEYEPKKSGNTVYDFTQTFNIRNDFAKQTRNNPNQYFIPIPLDSNIRKIDDATFQNYAEQGIDKICAENSPYKGDRNRKNLNKKNLSKFFTAIAKIETGKTT
ncbi:hypothetical protein IJM86_02765 [bacterium]|nr:hypothetical protein [bacterium]